MRVDGEARKLPSGTCGIWGLSSVTDLRPRAPTSERALAEEVHDRDSSVSCRLLLIMTVGFVAPGAGHAGGCPLRARGIRLRRAPGGPRPHIYPPGYVLIPQCGMTAWISNPADQIRYGSWQIRSNQIQPSYRSDLILPICVAPWAPRALVAPAAETGPTGRSAV